MCRQLDTTHETSLAVFNINFICFTSVPNYVITISFSFICSSSWCGGWWKMNKALFSFQYELSSKALQCCKSRRELYFEAIGISCVKLWTAWWAYSIPSVGASRYNVGGQFIRRFPSDRWKIAEIVSRSREPGFEVKHSIELNSSTEYL